MGKTYNQKWRLSAEDRTKAAMMTARQNVRGLGSAFGTLGRTVGLLGPSMTAFAGAAGLGAVMHAVQDTAAELDNLAKRSHALGMTSDELDAWDYAAQLSGASTSDLEAVLRRLPQAMYDAKSGSKMTADAFKSLGVEVTDEEGRLKGITEVMLDISRGMEGMASETERSAAISKVMGRSGTQMINMLKEGPDALQAMLVEAHAYGTRLDGLTVKGEEYQDAQLRMNRALRATKDAVSAAALPALTALAEKMAGKVLDAVTGFDREYREFLGTLRIVPHDMAMEMIAEKEGELRGEIDRVTTALEEQRERYKSVQGQRGYGIRAIGEETGQQREYRQEVEASTDVLEDLEAQLQALEQEKALVQHRLELMTEAEKRWAAAAGEGGDATDKLTAAQREAAKIMADVQTPLEKYFSTLDDLDEHLEAGRISEEAYARAAEAAGEAWDAANPVHQEHLRLMQRGAQVAESVATPLERYTASLRELDELFAEGALSHQDYIRAMVQAGRDYQASLRDMEGVGTDSMTTVQEAGVGAARAMGSAFSTMVSDAKIDLEDLARFANQVMGQVTSSLIQAGLVDPLVSGITGKGGTSQASGGLRPGEHGPPAPVTKSMGGAPAGGGGAPTVNINIQAVDTAGAVAVLKRERASIVGIVQEAYNRRGLPGPVG